MNISTQAAVLSAALAKDGQSWRQCRGTSQGDRERGEWATANHGSFTGDQVMLRKDVLTLAWDLAGPLVLSSLLHATTPHL